MKTELFKYLIQILDISIICFIIYIVYKAFKGTKILRIFGFFIGLFILKKISLELSLTYTSKALGFLIDNALVLFIIIFQEEIRKFINRVYSAFENLKPQDYNTASEIISDACNYFSNKKIGSLILIERSISLKPLVSKGVNLNADISLEILKNIFYAKSNLHDGAVIISREKIVSAGNFTSLTKNDNFDIKYGTQHESGIGISEESDCISIIVSEERGEIRIAENGRLSPVLSKAELKSILDKRLSVNQTESNKLAQVADSISLWFKEKFKKK